MGRKKGAKVNRKEHIGGLKKGQGWGGWFIKEDNKGFQSAYGSSFHCHWGWTRGCGFQRLL